MNENKKGTPVTGNPREEQNKSSQNGQEKKDGKSEKAPTMIEKVQTDVPKEREENEHQHDSKTPVGNKKQVNENQNSTKTGGKSL